LRRLWLGNQPVGYALHIRAKMIKADFSGFDAAMAEPLLESTDVASHLRPPGGERVSTVTMQNKRNRCWRTTQVTRRPLALETAAFNNSTTHAGRRKGYPKVQAEY
jgi:hypothetical protein